MLDCGGKPLNLSHPQVMGVVNVTPDSFADGGRFIDPKVAIRHALNLVKAGAAIIDIGGESTRPGAFVVSITEEIRRVVPVIAALAQELPVPISIDTSKPEVMTAAVAAGAGFINDVNALRTPGALQAASDARVPVCLMHMQGLPATMQQQPQYGDVVAEVMAFLKARVDTCEACGITRNRIVIDPGFGFGKTLQHNIILFQHLPYLQQLQLPVMVGLSRKSMIGMLLQGRPVEGRLAGSLAAALLAAQAGAVLLRVHDVKETVDMLKIMEALAGNHLSEINAHVGEVRVRQ